MSKKGLGRGLGALIPEVEVGDREKEAIVELAVAVIQANPNQPRKAFDPGKLEELADSIREHGLVQPIVVRPKGQTYEIVAGERRWRAAQLAGLEKVPALVREFSEAETMEIALIENLQREDLNPLEEADAFRILLEQFNLTQEELGRRLGKSRPQISNTLRLLHLGPVAKEEVRAGRLSMGHAKVLVGVENGRLQEELARRASEGELSVRQLEELVRRSQIGGSPKGPPAALLPDLAEVEHRLREHFGTPVRLHPGEKKGRIEITYFGEDGLGRILEALGLDQESELRPPRGPFRV